MELLKYFEKKSIYSAYKDNKVDTVEILFHLINKEDSKNVKDFLDNVEANKTTFDYNLNKLFDLDLNEESVNNLIKQTINKINKEFILYVINSDKLDCNDIYKINNSLFNLGEEIKLYKVKNITDLENISGLTYSTLGKEILTNFPCEYNSLTLPDLIFKLTGINLLLAIISYKYGILTEEFYKINETLMLIISTYEFNLAKR